MLVKCLECQKFNRLPLERINENPICGVCKSSLLKGPLDADQASFHEILKLSKLPVIVRISAIVTACFRFSVTGKVLAFEGSFIVV